MLPNNERNELENRIIKSIIENKRLDALILLQDKNVFSKKTTSDTFFFLGKYYSEKGHIPDFADLYSYLLQNNADNEARNYLTQTLHKVEAINVQLINSVGLLIEDSIKKEIINYANKSDALGFDFTDELSEKIASTLNKFETPFKKDLTNSEISELVYNELLEIQKGNKTNYIPTGIKSLDNVIIGVPIGQLTIIAARPSMGKSAFALQLALNFEKQNKNVLMFSLEMDSKMLFNRFISNLSGIDLLKLQKGQLDKIEMAIVRDELNKLAKRRIKIYDEANQSIGTIKARIKHAVKVSASDVIIVDYLTLIKSNYKAERHDLEIAKLINELRILAKETEKPIIVLSQLNRALNQRTDKRPTMADIRESGSIEQEANVAMLLHRPSYYGLNSPDDFECKTLDGCRLLDEEYFEVIIAKARNGKTGTVPLRYQLDCQRFEDVQLTMSSKRNKTIEELVDFDFDLLSKD